MAVFAALVFTPVSGGDRSVWAGCSSCGSVPACLAQVAARCDRRLVAGPFLPPPGGTARVRLRSRRRVFLRRSALCHGLCRIGSGLRVRGASSRFRRGLRSLCLWLGTIAVAATGAAARLGVPRQVGGWRSLAIPVRRHPRRLRFLAAGMIVALQRRPDSFLQTESQAVTSKSWRKLKKSWTTARLWTADWSTRQVAEPSPAGPASARGAWDAGLSDRLRRSCG